MTVYPTIAAQDRTRHWWLLGGIAVVVVALALASVGAVTLRGGSSKLSPVQPGVVHGAGMAPIMALTPARLAAGALSTGYQLARAQRVSDDRLGARFDGPEDEALHREDHGADVCAARRRSRGSSVEAREGRALRCIRPSPSSSFRQRCGR